MHPIIPLLQLVHFLQRIEGRKKLQKMVHILKEIGAPFPEPFEYSFYGMYSLQLKNEMSKLQAENLIAEEPQAGWGGHRTFATTATPELGELIEEFNLQQPPDWVNLARELNMMSPQKLEGISTILFLRRAERDPEAIREKLLSLKPHLASIADECINAASHFAPSR